MQSTYGSSGSSQPRNPSLHHVPPYQIRNSYYFSFWTTTSSHLTPVHPFRFTTVFWYPPIDFFSYPSHQSYPLSSISINMFTCSVHSTFRYPLTHSFHTPHTYTVLIFINLTHFSYPPVMSLIASFKTRSHCCQVKYGFKPSTSHARIFKPGPWQYPALHFCHPLGHHNFTAIETLQALKNDQANKEGWYCWEIWYSLWS